MYLYISNMQIFKQDKRESKGKYRDVLSARALSPCLAICCPTLDGVP